MEEKFSTTSNWLVYLVVLFTGLFFITRNNLGDDMNLVPGDLGDARFNAYVLEHGYKYFTGTTEFYWNAPFMVPDQEVISYSDNLLGILPFYAVFRLMNYDVLTSFQFMFLVLVILNYSTCFLFLKWIFKSPFAASIGAFIFAFSISLQSQITHAQTFGRFAGPLAFLFLLLFSKDKKLRNLFLSFVSFVWQLYSGIYLGLLFFVPYITVLLAISFKNNKHLPKEVYKNYGLPQILLCFLVPFLSIIPLLGPYLHRSSIVPKPGYGGVTETIPRLDSYLYSERGSLIWDFLSKEKREIPAFWDHQIFPGALALLSLIFMFFLTKPWRKYSSIDETENIKEPMHYLSLAAFVTFLIFLRIDKLSLYWVIHYLPGFGSMRSMTRIINIELLFFAAAASLLFINIHKKTKINSSVLLLILLPLLVADNFVYREFTYHTPKDLANERVKNLVVKMEALPKNSLISYEPDSVPGNPIEYQLDAMLASQEVGLKCVNGYSATSPREYTDFWNNLDAPSREKWFASQNYQPNNLVIIH
jgi:hypothetical protein